jgi:cobalt transport protein
VENLWEVPGETESLLFALQAAIGASIIGFFIGRYGKVPGGAPEKVAD